MQTKTTQRQQVQELAHRAGDGIEVTLLWNSAEERLTVICSDERTGDWFALEAEPGNALDVFHHPYAYAAHQGVEYSVPTVGAVEALAA